MELFSSNLKIDFLKLGPAAFILSALMLAGTVYVWMMRGEGKYGIDYKGGHEIVVQLKSGGTAEDIRRALEAGGVEGPTVQAFEAKSNDYSIRLGGENKDAKQVRDQVQSILQGAFKDGYEIKKTDYVGPTIGAELRWKATLAMFLGLIGILLYVAFRFEFGFALGAVVAIFHDVIIATGVYLASGVDLTMGTLAAALTIVGYSVNDTIVIFDRVREEIYKSKEFDLAEVMNRAINSTLSRTVITSGLTLLSALALLIFGGGAIQDLSLFLVAGIIVGSYSTIFIASPVTLAWHRFRSTRASAASA